jgi:hypothetical protein
MCGRDLCLRMPEEDVILSNCGITRDHDCTHATPSSHVSRLCSIPTVNFRRKIDPFFLLVHKKSKRVGGGSHGYKEKISGLWHVQKDSVMTRTSWISTDVTGQNRNRNNKPGRPGHNDNMYPCDPLRPSLPHHATTQPSLRYLSMNAAVFCSLRILSSAD